MLNNYLFQAIFVDLHQMTKRLLGIFLMFLYLIPTIGITGSVHYCGGEIAAIVILPIDEHPCACGPSEPMEDGCCADKAFSIKIKDTHKNADVKILINDIGDFANTQITYAIIDINAPLLQKKEQFRIKENEPPDKKLFILYESYLI